jgi:hypothetical protein
LKRPKDAIEEQKVGKKYLDDELTKDEKLKQWIETNNLKINILDNNSDDDKSANDWLRSLATYIRLYINNEKSGWDTKGCVIKDLEKGNELAGIDIFMGCTAGLRMKMEKLQLAEGKTKGTTQFDDFVGVIKNIEKNAIKT